MARTVSIKLLADVSQYVSGLKRGSDATKDFTGKLDQAAKAEKLDAVASQATRFGLAGVAAFGLVVKSAADFDKQMSAVSAATHANTKDMADLRAAALAAGKGTQFSATQAAQGITELSKAGVSTADILRGGLKGALDLAAAGQLSVGEAAETAASAMTQFKLKGDQVPHVADLLAAGAGKAQGSVHDMGMALNQSGLVAAQFGLSIEDTTGTLAEFAHAGLLGSDAGTSFKTMLLAIANPSGATRDLMRELGISFYDAQGRFIGLSGVAQVLQTRLKGLTDAQREQALGQLFGNDAIRSASILYSDGAKGVAQWRDAVDDAGFASDTAAKLTDNLAGDIERLKGSLETLAIESGSGGNSGLRTLTKSAGALVDQFGRMPTAVGGTVTVLAGIGGVTALAFAGFIKLRGGLATATEQLNMMGPAGEKAAVGLQKTAGAAGKAALAFIALEAGAAILNSFGPQAANVDRLADSLTNLANTGKVAGEAANRFGADLHGINDDAAVANSGTAKWLDKIATGIPVVGDFAAGVLHLSAAVASKDDYQTALKNFDALDQALTSTMTTTNDARKASQLWSRVASEAGIPIERLIELLPNAYKKVGELNTAAMQGKDALGGAASATGSLTSALAVGADAQDKYKTAAAAAAGATRGERDALVALSNQLKAQTDPVFGFLDAQDKMTAAQKAYGQAVKEHGRNSTEAKAALRELTGAAIDLEGKAGALTQTFNGKMDPALRATLTAAGLTGKQIDAVGRQFGDAKKAGDTFAKKYEAHTSAPGAKDAKKQLEDAYTAANHFAGPYRATVTVYGAQGAELQLRRLSIYQQALKSGRIPVGFNGPIKGPDGHYYAEGGWTGPGSKWEPAGVVHADEYVIKKESRQRIEAQAPGLLDAMNTTGAAQPPGYAGGGVVKNLPYVTTARGTRIPSRSEAAGAVVPTGGRTSDWIVAAARALVPGIGVISKDRPGAHTLSGSLSYHALGRAVDFAPSIALARRWHDTYGPRTKEEISPWRQYDIHNGGPHFYSPAIHNQHSGGNAHVHIAMGEGGVIREPIYGVGASGNTYSFGEGWRPETVTPGTRGGGDIYVTVQAGYITTPQDLENQITRTIDRLRTKGRV